MNIFELRERASELEIAEEDLHQQVRAVIKKNMMIEFNGPPTAHCMGAKYMLFGSFGPIADGQDRNPPGTLAEVVAGFLGAFETEMIGGDQIAWRRKPEITVHDAGYRVTARFAVFHT